MSNLEKEEPKVAHSSPDIENGSAIPIVDAIVAVSGLDGEAAAKDKALGLLKTHHIVFDPNSAEAKRVLRKIDLRILPLILFVYILTLLDKNSLSFAAIMGIKSDTKLTPNQYSWLGSIVYIGYIAGEIPATFLMQHVSLSKYFAYAVMIWGIVVTMHAVCHDFKTLATVRFLLGFIEVCTTPAAIYMSTSWYTPKEQITRIAIWYTAPGWAYAFGGFFAWAFNQAPSFKWQGLYIFYGCLTFIVGIFLFFFLAASPTDAKWLTEEEKAIALERVRVNKTGTETWRFNAGQLKECFQDPRFYIIFLLLVGTGLPNGGISVFGPSIIAAFGFTVNQTTLLNIVVGAAVILGTALSSMLAKYTNRTVAGVTVAFVSCVGVAMMLAIPAKHYVARYVGYIFTLQLSVCILFVITFMTAGVGGSTKKFAFGAAYQLGYAVGNLIGPQTFRAADAPNYYPAKYTMLAFLIFTMTLILTIGLIHKHWNSKRDKQQTTDSQNGVFYSTIENEEFADLTDFHIRSFRYPL